MKVTLVKVYTETDSHGEDVEMFRVYRDEDLMIEPKVNHKIVLEKGRFFIDQVEQNLKENKIYLYEYIEIPHYEFWSNKEAFMEKYLPELLEEDWKLRVRSSTG